jgi:hypothetical protein
MSTHYITMPREVEARKLAKVEPLERNGIITLAGVKLVCEDGTSVKWVMPNPLEFTPKPGDFLVYDRVVGVDYIVAGDKFEKLFQPAVAA